MSYFIILVEIISDQTFNYTKIKNISDQNLLRFKRIADAWNIETKKDKNKDLYFKKNGNINVWYSSVSTHLKRCFDDNISDEVLKELARDRTVEELNGNDF